MSEYSKPLTAFAYRALAPDRQPISGTIDAPDAAEAQRRLQSLHLDAIEIHAVETVTPSGAASIATASRSRRPLGSDDFLAFNQQLAQLAGAALPIEQGLRMIADEMRRGEMKRTLDQVVIELDSGQTLAQAVEKHRSKFPPLYSQLIDAGVRAGNLPGILLNLSGHLALLQRMQAMLWQTLTYPAIVLAMLIGVVLFVLIGVLPTMDSMYRDFHFQLPLLTRMTFAAAAVVSVQSFWIAAAIVVLALAIFWQVMRATGWNRGIREAVLLPLPLIGPVMRKSLIARWCDGVALGGDAGMDLPAAVELASQAIYSPAIALDSNALIGAISGGRPIGSVDRLRILPPTVLAAMDQSSSRGDLPATMHTLSQMYQEQAELRLAGIQAILLPLVMVILGLTVGLVILAILAPLLSLIQMISGPMWH